MKILVVEDEIAIQRFFAAKLKDHEYYYALTSQTAIGFLVADKFDIIFLDYDLGNGDNAVPVAEAIRLLGCDRSPEERIIITSNNPDKAELLQYAIGRECDIIPKLDLVRRWGKYIKLEQEAHTND